MEVDNGCPSSLLLVAGVADKLFPAAPALELAPAPPGLLLLLLAPACFCRASRCKLLLPPVEASDLLGALLAVVIGALLALLGALPPLPASARRFIAFGAATSCASAMPLRELSP